MDTATARTGVAETTSARGLAFAFNAYSLAFSHRWGVRTRVSDPPLPPQDCGVPPVSAQGVEALRSPSRSPDAVGPLHVVPRVPASLDGSQREGECSWTDSPARSP